MTYVPSHVLLEQLRAGNGWALGRLISRAEAGVAEARPALADVYRTAGAAHVIGLTGVPGSGEGLPALRFAYAVLPLVFKTLAAALLWRWRHDLETTP